MPPTFIPQYVPEQFVQVFRRIITVVASTFELNAKDLVCHSLVKPIVEARSVAMVMMREFSPATLDEVGLCFGRCHSAVFQAKRRVAERCETEPLFQERVETVRRALRLAAAGPGSPVPRDHASLSALLGEVEAKVRQLRATIDEMGAKV
jgi:hypothetical protein